MWVNFKVVSLLLIVTVSQYAYGITRALTNAATGLEAQQANIERLSSDLANVNTDAYKRSIGEFHDLGYETIREPGAMIGQGSTSPVGIQQGMGVRVGSIHKSFEQGPSRMTYRDFDWVIEGRGFFTVQTPEGEIYYTRKGSFQRDAQGRIVSTSGNLLIPQITVPTTAAKIDVTPKGEVKAQIPDQGGEVTIGQLQLVMFQNEQGLVTVGGATFRPSPASGPPIQVVPGEAGAGNVLQGALEGSNVNVPTSMVDMISTQRAYEMGTRVMGTVDKMLEATVNIR